MLSWIKTRSLAAVVLVGLAAGPYVRGTQLPARDPAPVPSHPHPPDETRPSSDLEARRRAVRKAEARYEIARQNRVLAEIDLEEQELASRRPLKLVPSQKAIEAAEADIARAEERLKRAEAMFAKGEITASQRASEELILRKTEVALEEMRTLRFRPEAVRMARQQYIHELGVQERLMQLELEREKAEEASLERRIRSSE